MCALVQLLSAIISIATWLMIANVILSWLTAFNVINLSNQFMYQIVRAVYSVTEPMVAPIRSVLPPFGNLDFSPIVVFLLLGFADNLLWEYAGRQFCYF